MKVSVIVPVYNTAAFLEKCLDSLVNQTLEEIEIIVVNDGSTDHSQEIIDSYSERYPDKIKAFQKPNGGLSDARNYGIDRASGEFIGFVDSDDFVWPEMFESLYEKAVECGAEIAFCDLEKVDEEGRAFRPLPQSHQLPEKIILKKDFTVFGEMACFACNKLFRKELFAEERFRKGVHFEDIDLIPRLVLKSKVMARVSEPFYRYFERKGSITKTHTEKGLDMFEAIHQVKETFDASPYSDKIKDFERFFIFQGYYSFLAYVAYVKDEELKARMLKILDDKIEKYGVSKYKIIRYKRFGRNYLLSLPMKKQIFYYLSFLSRSWLRYF